ncbi:DUF2063 domain-containing protein [Massilia sp. RP-1-19]|uniref:DUF2063 domain-containing protein n=1 Tax=Massilia polaris TaxID=2728846 RepID=A0A848HLI2_9BURK|nr:DNA-binding domain-containing protein [Massilia polaris]NML60999.1 DUF2063 domain-containing protein [Massilia polaris]
MRLADMQRDFRAFLSTASVDAASRLAVDGAPGLAVYQNNYRAQLVGVLEEAYPHLRRWIGGDAFHNLAITHIDSYPPQAWTLDLYPGQFERTLVAQYPKNPDLHELAWIEYTLSDVFVAQDAAPLAPAKLADIDWESARLLVAPSLRTRAATTNAEQIWSALWNDSVSPEGEMLAQPGGYIIWRRGFTSSLNQVDALELEALLHLRHNGSFATLCDLLVERLGDEAGVARAGELLANWLSNEMITGVDAA